MAAIDTAAAELAGLGDSGNAAFLSTLESDLDHLPLPPAKRVRNNAAAAEAQRSYRKREKQDKQRLLATTQELHTYAEVVDARLAKLQQRVYSDPRWTRSCSSRALSARRRWSKCARNPDLGLISRRALTECVSCAGVWTGAPARRRSSRPARSSACARAGSRRAAR